MTRLLETDIRIKAERFDEGLQIFREWAGADDRPGLFSNQNAAILAATDFVGVLRAVGFDPVELEPGTGDVINLGIPDFEAMVHSTVMTCLSYVARSGDSFLFDAGTDEEPLRFRWPLYSGRTDVSWSTVKTKAEQEIEWLEAEARERECHHGGCNCYDYD